MKLLFVSNDPFYFVTHRLSLARAARDRGYEVHVATPRGLGQERIVSDGFRFHPIALDRRVLSLWREVRTMISLLVVMRRVRPDIVHLLTLKPIVYGGLAARLAGVGQIVCAFTGLGSLFVSNARAARIGQRLTLAAARVSFHRRPTTMAIVQNREDRDFLASKLKATPSQIKLILGSGVSTQNYRPGKARRQDLVVLASRMLWTKGISDFVEAAKILKARGLNVRMALVGDTDSGNPGAVPTAVLHAWSQSGAVEWWGWRDDIPEILSGATIACLPSTYREGVPRFLIEAAASGAPLVATDVPGCREICRDGENGLLVAPRSPDGLADALATLLSDASMREKMGRRGREIVANEFLDKIVNDQTIAAYVPCGRGTPQAHRPDRSRILLCVTLSERGGAQRIVAQLAAYLARFADVDVAVGAGGPLVEELRSAGVTVFELPSLRREPALVPDLMAFAHLTRIIKAGRYDVVHAHSTKAGVLARLAARICSVRGIFFTAHGWAFTEGREKWKRVLLANVERFVALSTNELICVSVHDYRLALKLRVAPEAKLRIILNGANEGNLSAGSSIPSPGRMLRAAYVGRLASPKDPLLIIQAIGRIEGVELVVVGDGPMRSEVEAAIQAHGLQDRVLLMGDRNDVQQILAAVDFLVLASRWEGLPLAIIEAMMAGLPVIATRTGGTPELVQDGVTGILVESGRLDQLVAALRFMQAEPERRQSMGAAARNVAFSRFGLERMLGAYRSVYQPYLSWRLG